MTDVELYQPAAAEVVLASDIDSWTQIASQVIKLAKEIYDTPFVPDGLRGSIPAVSAAILAGRELGLPPLTSLANIHVIKGKPALSAALMRALILAQGHQIETVDISDTRVVIRGRRRGESTWEEASFTKDQAAKARIDLGGYPQDKLYARATSRLARRKFADVIAGMPYSAEDLEDGTEGGETPAVNGTAPATAAPAQRTARRRQAAPQTASPAESQAPAAAPAPPAQPAGEAPMPPLPGEDEAAEPDRSKRHRDLVGIIHQHFKRLGFTDEERGHRLAATAALAGINQIGSTNDLDEDELSTVADALAHCKDRGALLALLAAAADVPGAGE
jgi:hypothetical protein